VSEAAVVGFWLVVVGGRGVLAGGTRGPGVRKPVLPTVATRVPGARPDIEELNCPGFGDELNCLGFGDELNCLGLGEELNCRSFGDGANCLGFGVMLWSADGRRDLRAAVAGVFTVLILGRGAETSDMGGEGGTSELESASAVEIDLVSGGVSISGELAVELGE
jgi:hypothetical protein